MAILVKDKLRKLDVFEHALAASRCEIDWPCRAAEEHAARKRRGEYGSHFRSADEESVTFREKQVTCRYRRGRTSRFSSRADSAEPSFNEASARVFNIVRRWHELAPEDEQPYN